MNRFVKAGLIICTAVSLFMACTKDTPAPDPGEGNIAVTGITLNNTTLNMVVDTEETLIAIVAPDNATNKTVTWTSDHTDIATVNGAGKVAAIAVGTAKITAKAGDKTAVCTIEVTANAIAVTNITLNTNTLNLSVGDTNTLTAKVFPDNATSNTVTWTSDKTNIATVDATGKVTAIAAGTATITAKAGEKTATCTVTVIESIKDFVITSFSPTSAKYDATVSIIGTGFSAIASENTVTLNGISAEVLSATATEIKIKVPKNKNSTGTLKVKTGSKESNAATPFTYLLTWTASTLAGSNNSSGSPQDYVDNSNPALARFRFPRGVAVDAAGNVYVADVGNFRIRKISPSGAVTTLAGSGTYGSVGAMDPKGYVDGAGNIAKFNGIQGIVIDAAGYLYVAETENHCIRKIAPDGTVSTLTGLQGAAGSGLVDGSPATAKFRSPWDIAIDAAGYLYVADKDNHCIRKITPDGTVSTLAGSGVGGYADGVGTAAQFQFPSGIAVDGSGNVYVADANNQRIRKITPAGLVSTLAGSTRGFADGQGGVAKFDFPYGATADAAGNIYVADYINERIRSISPDGTVSTLGGTAIPAPFTLRSPWDIAVDASGAIYVAEEQGHRIRKIVAE